MLIKWDGAKWTGADVPDFKVDEAPNSGMNPFIMNEEGVGRLFCQRKLVDDLSQSITSLWNRRLVPIHCTQKWCKRLPCACLTA
nr:hypothetical protein [Alysiella crassa]UOP07815.1 hypothetical protein LVJ80_05595 [Alysiella crassa]